MCQVHISTLRSFVSYRLNSPLFLIESHGNVHVRILFSLRPIV